MWATMQKFRKREMGMAAIRRSRSVAVALVVVLDARRENEKRGELALPLRHAAGKRSRWLEGERHVDRTPVL
jgi:hypothetical protein